MTAAGHWHGPAQRLSEVNLFYPLIGRDSAVRGLGQHKSLPTCFRRGHRCERGRPMRGGVPSPDEAHGRRRRHRYSEDGKAVYKGKGARGLTPPPGLLAAQGSMNVEPTHEGAAVNATGITSPAVMLRAEGRSLESPVLGNGHAGFGRGSGETQCGCAPCSYLTLPDGVAGFAICPDGRPIRPDSTSMISLS